MNICLTTDSYKLNHWNQYLLGTTKAVAYFEARKGAKFQETVFFGLQSIIKKHLLGKVVTEDKINTARLLSAIHFGQATVDSVTPYILNKHMSVYINKRVACWDDGLGEDTVYFTKVINPKIRIDWDLFFKTTGQREYFNYNGWRYILEKFNGRLPIRIKAVPEGSVIPIDNVMTLVENTDDNSPWLTNFLETILSQVWYPCTVATLSREVKKLTKTYLDKNSDGGMLQFMLQDFGYRGATSYESAGIGGAAHLVNFMGTDTVASLEFAMAFYNADLDGLAYSVAATEHSIMTAGGQSGEITVLEQLFTEYPTGILSVVADSYDICYFTETIVGKMFKDRILARNGVFVLRPDSTTPDLPTPEIEMVWLANNLWNSFGGVVNNKGYKVINPKIRLLWGDGIDLDGIRKISIALDDAGFALENVACFGMGGGLLQRGAHRDVQRFAFKSCAQERNGQWYDIFKSPKDITKASKRGKLKLIKIDGKYLTVGVNEYPDIPDEMIVVYENGKLLVDYTFEQVRKNAELR